MREDLVGGLRGGAQREGDRVWRQTSAPYTVNLLSFLAGQRWPYAPAVLESTAEHTVMRYISGTAAITPTLRVSAGRPSALAGVAQIVRELHDLTAGTRFAAGSEVACHHDLDPRNTIYRLQDQEVYPVALIDWDLAAPGERVHDLAHVCWTYTGICPTATAAVVRDRIEACLEAYGWDGDLQTVVEAMLWWQDRCWRGIQSGAAAGDPALRAMVADGVVQDVRAVYTWTQHNLSRRPAG